MNFQLVSYTNMINVKKASEMKWALGGAQNHTHLIIWSPMHHLREKYTGKSVSPDGNIDPVPSGTVFRNLQTTPNTTSAVTNTNETVATTPKLEGYYGVFSNQDSVGMFKESGYTNSMVPNLTFNVFLMIISALWYFATNLIFGGCVNPKSNFFMRFLAYGGERLFFITMIFCSLELTMFSVNNVMHPNVSSIGGIISLILAIITIIFMVVFPMIIYRISSQHYSLLWHPEYYSRYGFLYCEFKLDNKVPPFDF